MPNESSPSRDSRLERVIAEYLQQVEEGHAPSQDDLLQAHPELADSLKAFFADHRRMRDLAALPDLAQDDATLPPSSSPADSGNADDDATISPTRRADAPAVGTRVRYFGDYELLEEIARGGMGVVYKARQTKLNRIVALKMILSGQLAGEEDVRRFHAEAEAAAQLDHPGIVPIFEVGEHEGQHYFSMAFVDGGSLADKIKDGPLPPREAAEYVKKVAEAVAYAHSKGVIHRDLKPGNILLDPNGEPKVTDFGLAKRVEGDSGLTATGQILGTPSYMPPEQASGKTEEVKEASDVYSLGAILYACLTGRPPFQAANVIDTLMQVLESDPPDPRQLNRAIARDAETIALKCLQKDPLRRYATAQLLRDELDRYLQGKPILGRRASLTERTWRWYMRNRLVGSLVLIMILGLLIGQLVLAASVLWATRRSSEIISQLTDELVESRRVQREAEQLRQDTAVDLRRLSQTAIAVLAPIPEPDRTADQWSSLGQCYYYSGKTRMALIALRRSIAIYGDTGPSLEEGPRWFYLTMALSGEGRTEDAIDYYLKLVELVDESSSSQNKPDHARLLRVTKNVLISRHRNSAGFAAMNNDWFAAAAECTYLLMIDPEDDNARERMFTYRDRLRESDPQLLKDLPSLVDE